MNDAEIVSRVRAGEHEAYAELVDYYQNAVYGLIYHHLQNSEDARDIAQETFIHAYTGLERLRDPAKFGPWVRQMAVNRCRMQQRQRRMTEPLEAVAPVASPDQQVDTRLAVQQALSCLSEASRLTCTLFYIESLSMQEIAVFLEVPVTTVKSRLRDARARLKKEMWMMVEDTLKQERLSPEFARGVEQLIEEIRRLSQAGEKEKRSELLSTSPYSKAAFAEMQRRGEWQKFTEGSRRIIFWGGEEASRRHSRQVEPEHLLLALLRETEGFVALLLQSIGLTQLAVQHELAEADAVAADAQAGGPLSADAQAPDPPKLSQQSERVLELAAEEAKAIGQLLDIPGHIYAEHLLLGLLRNETGAAARVPQRLGVQLESARELVTNHWRVQKRD